MEPSFKKSQNHKIPIDFNGPTLWWVWRNLAVEYLPLTQVYTFFWWRLYQCAYDLGYEPPQSSIILLILKQ